MTAQGARLPADGGGDGGGTVVSPCRRMYPPTRCSHVPRPQRLPSPPPTYANKTGTASVLITRVFSTNCLSNWGDRDVNTGTRYFRAVFERHAVRFRFRPPAVRIPDISNYRV